MGGGVIANLVRFSFEARYPFHFWAWIKGTPNGTPPFYEVPYLGVQFAKF